MAQSKKMTQGIDAVAPVGDAARQSLSVGLGAVRNWLVLAIQRADDARESVHQLRVYTRRTTAALRLYAGLLPGKQVAWFRSTLRKIRRAAGEARELDVLAEEHAGDSGKAAAKFSRHIGRRRKRAQRPIVQIERRLTRSDRWLRHAQRLLAPPAAHSSRGSRQQVPFGVWAKRRLRRAARKFFQAAPADPYDLSRLHRFRIRGKQLRYALELLAPAVPPGQHQELCQPIERLQELLGQIHDRLVARRRFKDWIAKSKTKRQAAHLRQLRRRERQRLQALLQEFARWWTPDFQRRLQSAFEQVAESCAAIDRLES